MLRQRFHVFRQNLLDSLVHMLRIFVHKVPHQNGDVFRALAEWRDFDRKYIEPVVQVRAESPVGHHHR